MFLFDHVVRMTHRMSCGERWRGPGGARVSARAAVAWCQGRDRLRRLLQSVVMRRLWTSHHQTLTVYRKDR